MSKHLVLIHGAFAGPWCMEPFATYLGDRGWTCHTPALRYHDGDPKAEPDPRLTDTGIDPRVNRQAGAVGGVREDTGQL